MAFHQFSRLDGAPLLPPLKVRFRWGYLFIFLLVSWWKSTSGYLLCLLVCRVLAAMCEKDEQSLLLLIFAFFILAFYPFPFGAHGETGAENRTIIPSAARLRGCWPAQPDSVEWCIFLCVYALCVHLGVGIISQPKKKRKIEKKRNGQKRHTNRNPPCI